MIKVQLFHACVLTAVDLIRVETRNLESISSLIEDKLKPIMLSRLIWHLCFLHPWPTQGRREQRIKPDPIKNKERSHLLSVSREIVKGYLKAFSSMGGMTRRQIGQVVSIAGFVFTSIKYGLNWSSIMKSKPKIYQQSTFKSQAGSRQIPCGNTPQRLPQSCCASSDYRSWGMWLWQRQWPQPSS